MNRVEHATRCRGPDRRTRYTAALVGAALLSTCASASAQDAANAALWKTIHDARVIDLSHTWDAKSPIASVNPPYSFALSAMHGTTRGIVGGKPH